MHADADVGRESQGEWRLRGGAEIRLSHAAGASLGVISKRPTSVGLPTGPPGERDVGCPAIALLKARQGRTRPRAVLAGAERIGHGVNVDVNRREIFKR